ncbi:MAG: hypothetical protein ACXAEI_10805 [Candidatus Hodarchaeales archaeon]|jgi:CheY-like chemotaxis protein
MSSIYKILLVDDDPEALQLTEERLQEELTTFQLVIVTSVAEAQVKLTNEQFNELCLEPGS